MGAFLKAASRLAELILDEVATRGIGRVARNPGESQRERVDDGLVPAGVREGNRMLRRGGVEVGSRRVATEFGFLITRTGHPLARRSEGGFPAQGGDEVVDRLHARGAGIHGSKRRILGEKGPRMEVSVVKTGHDGPAW